MAVEPLRLDGESVVVVGVEEEHRVERWGAVNGLLVHGSVQVVHQLVASFDGVLSGLSNDWEAVELAVDRADGLMVAVEWCERT